MKQDQTPTQAMVLAAGLGTRMRPVTAQLPKPLVMVRGKALIDYALDLLVGANVSKAVVNVHHMANKIESHLKGRSQPTVAISDERAQLMDTGGGLMQAQKYFNAAPIYYLNTDSIIAIGAQNPLLRLHGAWRDADKDVLLLLSTHTKASGYTGRGDFHLDPFGRIRRRGERENAPFIWTGAMILHPRILDGCPQGPFSTNLILNQAISRGRAYGFRHDAYWMHVGSPEGLKAAEKRIDESSAQKSP